MEFYFFIILLIEMILGEIWKLQDTHFKYYNNFKKYL